MIAEKSLEHKSEGWISNSTHLEVGVLEEVARCYFRHLADRCDVDVGVRE